MLHRWNAINHIYIIYFDETTESQEKINLFIRFEYDILDVVITF